jgi:ADP-ribosyl-[dinitrogen reductase] hydrolase
MKVEKVSALRVKRGLERGVTGYTCHSVPVALYAWSRHPEDFRMALIAVLDCGGDTDTVGAILGALMGARLGREAIPQEWLNGICDRPRNIGLLVQVAERLGQQRSAKQVLGPVRYFWPLLVVRNMIFLVTVLCHGFRRLLPPY